MDDQVNISKPKITPAKRKANKKYYENHKKEVLNYINEYSANRRKNDPEYRQRINEYYKKNYDEEARQKKRDYYLKRKQLANGKTE
jgi:hypothetical protein